jgi:hypothetical protein
MQTKLSRFSAVLTLTLLAGSALCTSALSTPAFADDGLGGPKVKDESVQGQPRKLAGVPGAREGAQRVPHRGFLRALLSLQKDDAPAGLRLSEGQLAAIRQANEQFVNSVQDYVGKNKATIEQLRDQLPAPERQRVDGFFRMAEDIVSLRDMSEANQPAKGGAEPRPEGSERQRGPGRGEGKGKEGKGKQDSSKQDEPKPDEPKGDEAQQREAREQLRTLMEGAPKPADAHAAMIAVLSEEQKAYVKEQGNKQRGQGEGRRPGGRGEAGEGPRLTEEQREKLRSMSPEERREFLKKLRDDRGTDKVKERGPKRGDKPSDKQDASDDAMMEPR